jgi:hypothetical protein
MGDEIYGRAELRPDRGGRQADARHEHEHLQAPHGIGHTVGVHGGQ